MWWWLTQAQQGNPIVSERGAFLVAHADAFDLPAGQEVRLQDLHCDGRGNVAHIDCRAQSEKESAVMAEERNQKSGLPVTRDVVGVSSTGGRRSVSNRIGLGSGSGRGGS
jgi:hypothetical protein